MLNSISEEHQSHWDNPRCKVVVLQLRFHKSFQRFKVQQIFIHMRLFQEIPYKQKTNRTNFICMKSNSNESTNKPTSQANRQITFFYMGYE